MISYFLTNSSLRIEICRAKGLNQVLSKTPSKPNETFQRLTQRSVKSTKYGKIQVYSILLADKWKICTEIHLEKSFI